MNTTIRRSAKGLALLFFALLININYIAFVQNDALRNRDGNSRLIIEEYDHERGSILVGRRAVAKSVETDGRLRFQRSYSDGPLFAPVTGYYSVYGATAIEKTENDLLAGTDDRLFVDRLTNLFTGRQPKGGNVLLTIDADAQRAAWDGLAGQLASTPPMRFETAAR